jgi:hydroxyethylthiazole kinase
MNSTIVKNLRERRPLVHQITNYVTVYDCAQITLCAGGLPVMACDINESADMALHADALVLNIGTLSERQIESMISAGISANRKGIPVILDPVGIGATPFRKQSVDKILSKVKVSVIKGNAAEISIIAGNAGTMKGVESIGIYDLIIDSAKQASRHTGAIIAVTGETDIVTDGSRTFLIRNGDPRMGTVVGTGCMSGAVIGCYCAVEKDIANATAIALSAYGIAGEKAATHFQINAPIAYKHCLIDEMSLIDDKALSASRIETI